MMALTAREDAFGHALLDHLHGGVQLMVDERDDGLVGVDSTAAYFAPYGAWPAHQQQAMRYAKGRTLDVGSGAGRHSLHLQRKGLDVLAIDSSPLAARVCRERGLRHVRVLPVEAVTPRLGPFDTVLMLGNNFGLFRGYAQGRRLLRRFKLITTDDARIIAESCDPYRSAHRFHREYHRSNRARGRMGGQVRMRVRYLGYTGPWFDYLLASRDEIRAITDGTAWRVTRFLGPRTGPYVVILEKRK